ncbi:Ras-related protein RABA2a [Araneus ventricosus]|uniref:Ras-related protein RABA2a n=1 Tax=Araneus ventricosus TaxID=182803 RepID=A0A4Y2PHM4_ARAVE|nr:Ras-related protein RABA2a [Araneus ventricosus]
MAFWATEEDQKCTLIVDNYNKTINLKDKKIDLELWDTAGQERYKAIVKEYFRKADGVLLAYDMTNLTSFMKLSSWLDELRALNEEATVFIVGNKSDLPHQNQVSRTTVENYARQEGLDFCETSAKNNENVDEVFQNLALKVLERKKITPFCEEIPNGEIKPGSSSNAACDNSQQQTENSLPPIIRFEDDFGNVGHVIKLTIEKPKEKQKKSCC